ncbi:DapH/DapD/GlmU-related protein [Vibrio splendidus]
MKYQFVANIYRVIFGVVLRIISNTSCIKCKVIQPTLFLGKGSINVDKKTIFGVIKSPDFFSYGYVEARSSNSKIEIFGNVVVSNKCKFIADSATISIHDGSVIGGNCTILTSDFHKVGDSNYIKCSDVTIKENVFIGSDVTILKGVVVGKGSVIANGCLVTKNVPEQVIFAGNPGRVVKKI